MFPRKRAARVSGDRFSVLLNEAATRQKKAGFMYKHPCPIPGLMTEEFIMRPSEQIRFDKLYKRHLRALKLRGLSDKTIDVYARAVRRIAQHYDYCPDRPPNNWSPLCRTG